MIFLVRFGMNKHFYHIDTSKIKTLQVLQQAKKAPDAIGPESVRTPQWFLAMINALILLHEMFFLKY